MRLSYLELSGFRGYNKRLRIDFADRFTIIDGRNGVGKSTIFDAVEFALTGTIAKYKEQTASGETIADYIWWTGEGPKPASHYVEAGFTDEHDSQIKIRRNQFEDPSSESLEELVKRLCDQRLSPPQPLQQLCQSAIIRDEHITALSMDLKETDRYVLLRNALGATDADQWIQRGARLVLAAKKRAEAAQSEVQSLTSEVAIAARRLDEQRARLVGENVVAEATDRLRAFAGSGAPLDELIGPARAQLARVSGEIASLRVIAERWNTAETARSQLSGLLEAVDAARNARESAEAELKVQLPIGDVLSAAELTTDATAVMQLVMLGRKIGLRDGHCPLCAADRSPEQFRSGLEAAEAVANKLSETAASAARRAQARLAAEAKLVDSTRALAAAEAAKQSAVQIVESFEQQRRQLGVTLTNSRDDVLADIKQREESVASAQRDMRVLETVRSSAELERALRADADTKTRLGRAQERLGRALKAGSLAQTFHDATRRAASETLDLRLERVLPLMSELYRRLRPHPVWSDIEYSIRGDVRRFLKLQVGDNLNPQFLFSSGQRRATGLAFLLSVNLSLAWSRWGTILLDDPVQHIDDFRTVHLAELLAKLVADGRQVICAVEDSALADLLCRRLPVSKIGDAKRISLGSDEDGFSAIVGDRALLPLPRNALVTASQRLASG